jgi:serine protease Do
MSTSSLRRVVTSICVLSLVVGMASGIRAQDSKPEKGDTTQAAGEKQSTLGNAARRILERMTSRQNNVHERNHTSVKAAFGEVIRGPAQSTVRVYADGQQVALGGVVTSDGFILTKASELYGSLECVLQDGRRLPADFVGQHRESDLGMLKVGANDLTPLTWSDADAPPIGSWLISPGMKGDPLGIGVVSVKPRPISSPHGLLGVQLRDAEQGPQVVFILPNSAAQDSGVKVNDIITHINGLSMKSHSELQKTIRKFMPGERVRLSILRGTARESSTVILGSAAAANQRQNMQNNLGGPKLSKRNAGFPAALQHDMALHPYQCGGPVVDLDGRAVGINIAHSDRVSSFALPTSVILPLLEDLKSGKLRPGPSEAEAQLELQTRAEELRKRLDDWTQKVSQLQVTLKEREEAEAVALKAAQEMEADAEVQRQADQAKKAKAEIEMAFQNAKKALDEVTSELKVVESKVTLQSE